MHACICPGGVETSRGCCDSAVPILLAGFGWGSAMNATPHVNSGRVLNPPPIMIHDGSLLESADGRAPRQRQRLIQIFAAESGDLHFVQGRPIKAFVLAVEGEIQQVVVWENAKVTIDPQPAAGGRQTEDFLPFRHEPHCPAGSETVLHHTHTGEEIVG
jgi:hypothetical protein